MRSCFPCRRRGTGSRYYVEACTQSTDIDRLSQFDQTVFKHRFQQRLSMASCLETLRGYFPNMNELQLAGSVARINTVLTPTP